MLQWSSPSCVTSQIEKGTHSGDKQPWASQLVPGVPQHLGGLTTGQGWPLILPIHKYDNQERVCANHALGDIKVKMLTEYLIVGTINHNLDWMLIYADQQCVS